METKIEEILSQRQKTYGDFSDNASLSQHLKAILRNATGWHSLNNSHKESLEMIMCKVSRIVTGDPTYKDSWADIAGFATLGGEGM